MPLVDSGAITDKDDAGFVEGEWPLQLEAGPAAIHACTGRDPILEADDGQLVVAAADADEAIAIGPGRDRI